MNLLVSLCARAMFNLIKQRSSRAYFSRIAIFLACLFCIPQSTHSTHGRNEPHTSMITGTGRGRESVCIFTWKIVNFLASNSI